MERPDFTLSEQKRIAYIHAEMRKWMHQNGFELYEVKRAIAMTMRLEDEQRTASAMAGRRHE